MTYTYLLQLIVPLKNAGPTILLAFIAHQTPIFTGWSRTSWVRCGVCELRIDYFAYLCSTASETTLHQK
jgi:hypothetical protein